MLSSNSFPSGRMLFICEANCSRGRECWEHGNRRFTSYRTLLENGSKTPISCRNTYPTCLSMNSRSSYFPVARRKTGGSADKLRSRRKTLCIDQASKNLMISFSLLSNHRKGFLHIDPCGEERGSFSRLGPMTPEWVEGRRLRLSSIKVCAFDIKLRTMVAPCDVFGDDEADSFDVSWTR